MSGKRKKVLYTLLSVFMLMAVTGTGLVLQVFLREHKAVSDETKEIEEKKQETERLTKETESLNAESTRKEEENEAERQAEETKKQEEQEKADRIAKYGEEGLKDIREAIEGLVNGQEGTWSVYVKKLDKNKYCIVNDMEMSAGTQIELFIMADVETIPDKDEDIIQSEKNMIHKIDIGAVDSLLHILDVNDPSSVEGGRASLNTFIDQEYDKTRMNCGILQVSDTVNNYTSAQDLGRLMEKIYRGKKAEETAASNMWNLLSEGPTSGNQENGWNMNYIRNGLPEGSYDACIYLPSSSSGDTVLSESAIIDLPDGQRDYVLVIMAQDVSDKGAALQKMTDLSAKVYEIITKQDGEDTNPIEEESAADDSTTDGSQNNGE